MTVSEPKRHTVKYGDAQQRQHELHELLWLYRTAQLPHDAEYQREDGTWAPVEELVEPLLAGERQQKPAEPSAPVEPPRTKRLWPLLILTSLVVIAFGAPNAFWMWQHQQQVEAEVARAAAWEQSERLKDNISSGRVAIGMTPEQVVKAWGQPKQIIHENGKQRWIYKRGTLTLEGGRVISLDGSP